MVRYDASKKYVLYAREKHSDRFLDATTEAAFHKSAVKLLTERYEAGWYGYFKSETPKKPDLSKEQIEALPKGEVKKTAVRQWREYQRELLRKAESMRLYEEIVKAVQEKDGPAAWSALKRCGDGEYEYVELEELET